MKQKATGLGWPQSSTVKDYKCDQSSSGAPLQVSKDGTLADTEGEELPLSSQLSEDQFDDTETLCIRDMSVLQGYNKFKSEQDAKFKEWLQEP